MRFMRSCMVENSRKGSQRVNVGSEKTLEAKAHGKAA